jgi:hypothetical protein
MKELFLLIFVLATKVFPFTNHVFEYIFSNNGHWNVIQLQNSNIILKWVYIYIIVYIIKINLW